MLQVNHLSKYFKSSETSAISDVSFALGEKEILSIFGRSGSGKTTLLKAIAGLLQPDKGQIILYNEPIIGPADQLVPGHDEIKMVFQDYQLKYQMTVEENINYALLSYTDDYRKYRLETVLSICLLDEFKNQYVQQLSGGQKQRVAIARAIANEPKLLLMDEPFSNLDLSAKETIRNTIKNIVDQSDSSVIFVSHDPEEVMMISDQVVILENGTIKQIGTPMEIYRKPNSLSIAEMFGPVNQIKTVEKTIYCRPESLIIHPKNQDTNALTGIIKSLYPLGKYQILKIATEVSAVGEITCYDYGHDFKQGDTVNIDTKDCLPFFSD